MAIIGLTMKLLTLKVAFIFFYGIVLCIPLFAANRYWVHKTVYQNFFSSGGELADWQLIEDNGTGGFVSSGSGTAILTMDDAAGGFANRLFNINGGSPRLMPFDAINGRVELLVKSITGGNQRIFLQAQEFDGSATYLGQVNILPAQSATGFFSVNLSSVTWDPSTAQVRFIIGGENFSGQQGTVEFSFFSYSNINGSWDNTANWSATSNGPGGASVPGPADSVIFDGAGNSNGSCLLDVDAAINALSTTGGFSGNIDLQNFQLTIGAGGMNLSGGGITGAAQNVQVNGNVSLSGGAFKNPTGKTYISGDIQITGGILNFDSGTVVVNGIADQQFSNTLITPVHNFTVNKASGAVNFISDILVSDSLVLTQGILNTNSNTVRLGTGGADTGTLIAGAGKINGNFARWVSSSSSGNLVFPLGNAVANAPLILQLVSAPSSGGRITASYTDASPGFTAVLFSDNSATITQVSTAFWTVQTSGISDGNYSLSLSNDHLGANPGPPNLDLTLANGVVGLFQPATGTASNPVLHRSGLSAAGLANSFFAGVSTVPLPLTWLSFDISQHEHLFTWNWRVSSEENLAWYAPEYSTDGIHFIMAGKVTPHSDNRYRFSTRLAQAGTIFFRVGEMDRDGKTGYSTVNALTIPNTYSFNFYPNPVKDKIVIQWPYADAGMIHTTIADSRGNRILDRQHSYAPSLSISLTGLAAGTYFIRCSDNRQHQSGTYRLVKEAD